MKFKFRADVIHRLLLGVIVFSTKAFLFTYMPSTYIADLDRSFRITDTYNISPGMLWV